MNVRWDAVVADKHFWAEPPRPTPAHPRPADGNTDPVSVKVWLYGSLANVVEQRPLELPLPQGFSVSDVMAELGQRYGEEFREHVFDTDGRKTRLCRVFVDGMPADDVDVPVHTGSTQAEVEMILLTAIEGG